MDWEKKFKKLRDRFSRKEKVKVPKDWARSKVVKRDVELVAVEVDKPKRAWKLKVPGLRQVKRVLAAVLLVINFASGVMSVSFGALEVALLFLPTSFVLADYVWKTRSV